MGRIKVLNFLDLDLWRRLSRRLDLCLGRLRARRLLIELSDSSSSESLDSEELLLGLVGDSESEELELELELELECLWPRRREVFLGLSMLSSARPR